MRYLRRTEVQLLLTLMVITALWIILNNLFSTTFQQYHFYFDLIKLQYIKGVFFVIVVSLILHLLISSVKKKLLSRPETYKNQLYRTTVNHGPDNHLLRADLQNPDALKNIKNNKSLPKNNKLPGLTLSLALPNETTELEKAREELQRRENQLKQILNNVTDGFFILNKDLKIEKANDVFKKLVEVKVDMVEGKRLPDLFPCMEKDTSYTRYVEAIQQHSSVYFESFNYTKKMWFRISGYPFEGGLSVFFRDITKEKEVELHIYRNEQNLLALINNTGDLIWSIDNNFRYFTFNEPYEKWYRRIFNESIYIGKIALNEAQGQEHVEKWKTLYGRALKGEKFSVEMNFIIDSKCHFTTVRFNPIFNADKKVAGAGCFLQDITETKLYERKIEQQNQKLKDIAFITSHQVRVPLANILGLVEILDHEDPSSSDNRTIIGHIKTSAMQLDETIINMVKQANQAND